MKIEDYKMFIDAETINLDEIGWSESRTDKQIIRYIQSFVRNNYDKKISKELAFIFVCIIDNLLSDLQKSSKFYDCNAFPKRVTGS